MRVAAFYHAWTPGAWRQGAAEFREAIQVSGFPGPVFWFYEDGPSEASTINALRAYAQEHDGAILYAHSKGSATVEPFRDRWRRSMTQRVVFRWQRNLAFLEDHDAVGCHWLTEAEYPGMFGAMTVPAEGSGFFGGNFWMARCDYLRTLPPCAAEPRWQAEQWIGINHPRVVDLLPGWPHDNRWPELCG